MKRHIQAGLFAFEIAAGNTDTGEESASVENVTYAQLKQAAQAQSGIKPELNNGPVPEPVSSVEGGEQGPDFVW